MLIKRAAAGAAFLSFAYCSASLGADYVVSVPAVKENVTQSLVLDGSLGLLYTDNALATQNGRIDAGFAVPFLKLTYGLKTMDGWAYTIYARTTSESYTDRTGDNAFATTGTTLSKTTGDLTVGANFDTKFFFDGFYATSGLTAYDLSGFVTQPFKYPDLGLTIVPRFTVGYRWADMASAERAFIDAQLLIEKVIAGPWSVVTGGRLRVFRFQIAVIGPVPTDVYGSGSLGLKYDFGHDITLTTSIAALARRSNVTARNYERLDIGPSLDFKYVF